MAFLTPTAIPTSGANSSKSMVCGQRPWTLRVRATPAVLSKPMTYGVRMSMSERTFIAVKPDGMNRGLLGDIISRFEAKGYQLVGIKTLVPSKQLAETHYAALREKPFFPPLVDFITSGPVCAMVWQGEGVVTTARKMIGETNPLASAPGTIRGDFAVDVGRK